MIGTSLLFSYGIYDGYEDYIKFVYSQSQEVFSTSTVVWTNELIR